MKRIDSRPVPKAKDEIRAFLVVRNEMLRLPSTLRHHRLLGVHRFFAVDNGSTDGTLDYLASEPDVHVFSTTESYAQSVYGVTWANDLLDKFGTGHWTLTIDADEQFIYPHFEEFKLPFFCQHLDAIGAEAVCCLFLDMYSDLAIQETRHDSNNALLETCGFFDVASYRLVRCMDAPYFQINGGVRERMFQNIGAECHAPTISKVPLVKWAPGRKFICSTHTLTPVKIAPIMAVLLHFKFLSDFHERVEVEMARNEHYANAREYRAYWDMLRKGGPVKLLNTQSARFESSAQLVKLNLMSTSKPYEDLVRSIVAARTGRAAPERAIAV
jgi:glycosyltransferase involved in cell wall biosynthesis